MPWDHRTKRRLKLRDLDILLAVVETGSMGKAAKHLNTSQPAVSKAVVELEDALGVRLVDRSRRGVVPTSYGLALAKRSVAVFNDLRQGVQDIDFLSDPTKGEIRVGTTEPIATAIVLPAIDRLSRKYPQMFLSRRRRRYGVAVRRCQPTKHRVCDLSDDWPIARRTCCRGALLRRFCNRHFSKKSFDAASQAYTCRSPQRTISPPSVPYFFPFSHRCDL